MLAAEIALHIRDRCMGSFIVVRGRGQKYADHHRRSSTSCSDAFPDLRLLEATADKVKHRKISMSGSLRGKLGNGRQQHKDRRGIAWIVLTLDTATRHIQWIVFGQPQSLILEDNSNEKRYLSLRSES